jgi:hypothetical protein
VHKTKRESTSSPNIAIQKASFLGSFLKRVWEELFLEKVPPTKLPTKSRPLDKRWKMGYNRSEERKRRREDS